MQTPPLCRVLSLYLALPLLLATACGIDDLATDPAVASVDPLDRDITDDEGYAGAHLAEGDVATAGADAFAVPTALADCTVTVNAGRELVIRALGVVEDPVRTRWTGSLTTTSDGAWHFGRLMTQMAGNQDPSTFVRDWLHAWEVTTTVNGFAAGARPAISNLIAGWPKLPSGRLDLTRSPLRLLAIVNRFDLRSNGNAGEGRFVFGVLDAGGAAQSFTVILEYKLPAATAASVQSWASDWHKLRTLTPGTATYNAQLEKVTNRFARAGAAPTRPNGSAIGQVRTNEIALASPWQLREFRLSAVGKLVETTVLRTPARSMNGSAKLGRFVTANQAAILAGTHGVPLSFESAPFRANAINNNIDFWSVPGFAGTQARHLLSLNTCDGCHGAETGTGFLQVSPRELGQIAPLAPFMTGSQPVTDPTDPNRTRTFNDIQRRAVIFKNFLCGQTAAGLSTVERAD